MKELSIEEKAKAYDEAIKKAKSKIWNDKGHVLYEDDVIEIFPELKESEDERMRRWIINYLDNKALNSGIIQEKTNIKNAIAWLEKQGEQKPAWSEEDERIIMEIISDLDYCKAIYTDDKYESIDNEINWLKSLKDRVLPQPKQEWSKEDERIKNVSISFLEEFKEKGYENAVVCIDWLKSLHPRTKQEWGWNDSNILKDIDHILDAYKNQYHGVKPIEPIKEWLCHLNPQKQWKPSEEQMEALDDYIYAKYPNKEKHQEAILSLFNDLKTL